MSNYHLHIINGPNLNQLEFRDQHYGSSLTLDEIIKQTNQEFKNWPTVKLHWFQSNHEGELIDYLQKLNHAPCHGVCINPGGFSHTSVAIHDALELLSCLKVEVHLSHLWKRESFRCQLLTAKACEIIMSGLGSDAYSVAIHTILKKIGAKNVSDN